MNFNLFKNHVRFKIALELIDLEDGLSIMQLNQRLTDVPQSTLYRQVNAMMDDQLLKVVAVQRVGKVEEKIYALNTSGYQISEADWNLSLIHISE
ncbi:transcriptional regulator, partial [Exiguobacterium sp. A1_3_1]